MNDETITNQKNERFLPSGKILNNRFEIKEPVRKTSGCIVYRAWDKQNNVDKALLLIPPIIQADFEAMDSLRESAQLLKWLNHPYIARYYGFHTSGEYSFFEMEFVAGKSIKRKKFESPDKKFSENMAKWGALQILEGLSFAHNQNILHRNIKPQKIIFNTNGQVRLIDFGISEALRNAMAMVRDITSQSAILFMPPEQIKGQRLSVQSDIYSLGATLYYLLDGKPPFHQGDIYYQILNEKPAPIQDISDGFNYILQICLAKDISDRFETCEQMTKEIRRLRGPVEETKISSSEPVTKSIPSPVSPPTPPKRPQPKIDIKPVKKIEEPAESYNDDFFDKSFFSVLSEKIRENKKILLLTSLLFIIVITSILYNTFVYDNKDSSLSTANQQADNVEANSETSQKMIKALNEAGDVHFSKERFIAPPKNNAIELYHEVLQINPNEKHALDRIEQIKNHYLKKIKLNLSNFLLSEAETEINQCLEVFKNDTQFLSLKQDLQEKISALDKIPLTIEILNGSGVSGIARTLQNYLKDLNYKVIHTENYRVNGQINWNVKNTLFIGSIPKNKRVQNLENILNVEYDQNALKNKQTKYANILIVLGKDYKRITPLK